MPETPPQGQGAPAEEASSRSPSELDTLRAQLAKAEQERDEYRTLLQRKHAEFENYQKRNQRDQDQERRYRFGPMALELLPILDNFERAMEAAKQAGETGPLVQGVALVQNQILDAFRRQGITRMDALGQHFDPHLHQAVMQQPTTTSEPNTIVQVLEHGFMLHDRVLRPASVAVACRPEKAPAQT